MGPFKIFNKLLNSVLSYHELSIEEISRRKLLLVFLFMNIPADFSFGTYHLVKGAFDLAVINYGLTVIMTIFIVLLRYLKSGRPVYRVTALLYTLTLVYWVKTGAIDGYGSIWSMLHPLFVFFLFGKREGFAWSLIFTAVMLVLFTNPFAWSAIYPYSPLFTSRFLLTFAMIFIFTYSYENLRTKYKEAMEKEQDKLLLEKEKLAETNNLLKEEMRLKELAEIELRRHRDHLEEMVAARTLEIQRNSEELAASEKRYRLMADNVNDLIWLTDMDLKFLFISPSVEKMHGYSVEEAMSLPHDKWNSPESYAKIMETYRQQLEIEKAGNADYGKNIILQLEQIKKDGTLFPVELRVSFIRNEYGTATGIVGITRDITDRIAVEQEKEKIKEQLSQSQKMEAIGTLVGGLAHDFNNFLSGIIGGFELLSIALKKEKLENREYIEKYINLGIESANRSAGLINQLLVLSRRHEIKLEPLDIRNSLNNIYELCRNSFPKSIVLNFKIQDSPLVLIGDMIQIEQVLLNLCINASHAMTVMRPPGEQDGGTLTVIAEKVESDYLMKKHYPEAAKSTGQWIRINISDTGVGIDNETKQRIFEPFFSTKNKNTSTGLGLAISYNIIKKHGGLINVYSEPGCGSCFSLYFPVYEQSSLNIPGHQETSVITGSGTILIIDDEPVILKIAEGFLKECGYNVIAAEGAVRGIEIFAREHSGISAVMIDLSMPEKTGIEVFQELKKIDPGVRAVLSSGMLDSDLKDKALKMGVRETLKKPYLAAELSMIMKSVTSGD